MTVLVVAGVALLVGLFFVFRGDDGEVDAGSTLDVVVRGGEPAGGIQHLTVTKDDEVLIRVSSDVEDEVHVHGYDVVQDVAAAESVEIRFKADIVGRFEIELEQRGTPIAELEVRP